MGFSLSDESNDDAADDTDSDGQPETADAEDGTAGDRTGTAQSVSRSPPDDGATTVQPPTDGTHQPESDQPGTPSVPPKSDLAVLRTLDAYLDDIDTGLPTARERARARDTLKLENRLGGATTTQATLGFDYVRDDGIAVDGDSYIGLLKVRPQQWLSLSDEAKRDTMSAYMSFLLALDFSVTITCYPKPFDLTDHLERFHTAGADMAARDQSPILQYGRKFYIKWASANIDDADLKQRAFYVVTRVDADQVHEDLETGSVASQLSSLPIVGSICSSLVDRFPVVGSDETAGTDRCIREVRHRQRRITTTLGRTDVSIETVTDRQETMAVLYHYYNHADPPFETFSHATKTMGGF